MKVKKNPKSGKKKMVVDFELDDNTELEHESEDEDSTYTHKGKYVYMLQLHPGNAVVRMPKEQQPMEMGLVQITPSPTVTQNGRKYVKPLTKKK